MCTMIGYRIPERETFRMLPLISFCILTFCKNRTFRFTPVICKDCTILSREWHNHSCGLMVCFKPGDWILCTILGYGLPERETYGMLLFVQLLHSCLLTKWKKCNMAPPFLLIHIVDSTFHHSTSGWIQDNGLSRMPANP